MVYAGPCMWLRANPDSIPVLQMLYDTPTGLPFSRICNELSFNRDHLVSLLAHLKGYLLVESFRPIPNQKLEWRIPADSLLAVSKILVKECAKTTPKIIAECA